MRIAFSARGFTICLLVIGKAAVGFYNDLSYINTKLASFSVFNSLAFLCLGLSCNTFGLFCGAALLFCLYCAPLFFSSNKVRKTAFKNVDDCVERAGFLAVGIVNGFVS